MDARDFSILKDQIDGYVRITCFDGESFIAKVLHVSEIEQDVIYDLVETNRPSKYEGVPNNAAYQVMFTDIASVEAAPPPWS